ncbi:MAG TPA: chemotaxis protein CheB [Gemmatimonadaceae bacterium]|nr:chemotaxis protein CheB [Gemmatimonadaceae bacterium]
MLESARARKPRAVVCAASAGGFPTLLRILRALPSLFQPPIVIVLHVSRAEPSALADVLRRASKRSVKRAEHGETLEAGIVYVAPPNYHVVIRRNGTMALTHEPPEHHVRPAADPLFVSAARAFKRNVIAIVLSGSGRDGATGARAIHDAGGFVIVEDPSLAQFPSMPLAAIAAGAADEVLASGEIAGALVQLAS